MATAPDLSPHTPAASVRPVPGHALAALILVVLAVVTYGHTLEAPFVFDDVLNIEQNASVRMTSLDWSQLKAAAFEHRDNDRPLAYLSFALTHYVFGGDVAGYHLVNIAIHVVTGMLVYLLALQTFGRLAAIGKPIGEERWWGLAALLAAMVFVAHPIQTQAVTYTVQRMTSMATMFYLFALLMYVVGRASDRGSIRWSLWATALVAWLLALGTKQIAATLPLAVLLYEWFFFQDLRREWARRMFKVGLVPVALLTLLVGAFYLDADLVGRLERGYATRDFSMAERLMTQTRVVAQYVGMIFYPAPDRLCLVHAVETSRSLFAPVTTALAGTFLMALLIGGIVAAKRWRIVSFAVLWFFLHLAIESTVLPLEMMYEHRLYLPMVGVSLAVGYGALFAVSRWVEATNSIFESIFLRPAVVATAAAVLIAVLSFATWNRNRVWCDAAVLWTDVIAKNDGDFAEATAQRARAYNNRGRVYGSRGLHRLAISDFSQAVALDSLDAEARFNRGLSLAASEQVEAAVADFSAAIELRQQRELPFAEAHLHRGRLLAQLGDYEAALVDLETAVEQSPRLGDAYLSIAWIRATCPEEAYRDADAALAIARAGCGATAWQSSAWLDSLACAYAAAGKFDAAVHWEAKAIELLPEQSRDEYRRRIEMFGQQRAYYDGKATRPAKAG